MAKLRDYSNICILQTAFLGDIALTLPLAQTIRKVNPKAKITFVTHPVGAALPRMAKSVDEVIIFDKRGEHSGVGGIFRMGKKLREKKFDLLLSPHRSARSAYLANLSKIPTKISFDKSTLSFLYDIRAIYKKDKHEIDRVMELLSSFNLESEYVTVLKDVELSFEPHSIEKVESLIATAGQKSIAMAPGSVWATKRWLPEYYNATIKLLENHGYQIYLIGSKSDEQLCKEIAENTKAINLAGKLNISESIYLLSKVETLLSNDSAPVHFAGLAGCRVIAIFGPTSPIFGFYPRGERDLVLEDATLKCKPCRIHGSDKCPIGTHDCMKNVKPADVVRAILK